MAKTNKEFYVEVLRYQTLETIAVLAFSAFLVWVFKNPLYLATLVLALVLDKNKFKDVVESELERDQEKLDEEDRG